jgi:hypothetical protein
MDFCKIRAVWSSIDWRIRGLHRLPGQAKRPFLGEEFVFEVQWPEKAARLEMSCIAGRWMRRDWGQERLDSIVQGWMMELVG